MDRTFSTPLCPAARWYSSQSPKQHLGGRIIWRPVTPVSGSSTCLIRRPLSIFSRSHSRSSWRIWRERERLSRSGGRVPTSTQRQICWRSGSWHCHSNQGISSGSPRWVGGSAGVASALSSVTWTPALRAPGSLDNKSAFWLEAPGRYLMS